jgi:hypothetical protein
MEPILATLATTAVVQGIHFVYKEASEVLSAWRKRRQDEKSPPPKVVETPKILTVGSPQPLTEPVNQQMQDKLEELRDLAAQVKDGEINPDSPEARSILSNLRELLEAVLQAPITFAGEAPRTVRISDIDVTVQNVSGKVAGLRASLEKLQGPTDIHGVKVKADDVQQDGEVTGVDLT